MKQWQNNLEKVVTNRKLLKNHDRYGLVLMVIPCKNKHNSKYYGNSKLK